MTDEEYKNQTTSPGHSRDSKLLSGAIVFVTVVVALAAFAAWVILTKR